MNFATLHRAIRKNTLLNVNDKWLKLRKRSPMKIYELRKQDRHAAPQRVLSIRRRTTPPVGDPLPVAAAVTHVRRIILLQLT